MVLIRPAPIPGSKGGRSFGFKEFDPFWARVAEAKVLVAFHASDAGYDKIYKWWVGGAKEFLAFEQDAFQHVLDVTLGRPIQDSLAAVICHGVFDRHPNVRVASLESGSAWLEPLLKRLDHAFRKMPQEFKQHPVEVFRRHISVAPFYEDPVPRLVELIGADNILFGSDWPHPEGLANPLDFYKDIQMLSPEIQQKIMSTNLKNLLAGNWN